MTTVACRILTPWLAVLIGRWACSLCVSADFRRSCRVRKPEVLAPRLCVALDGTLIRSDLFLESLLLLLKRNPLYLFHTLVMAGGRQGGNSRRRSRRGPKSIPGTRAQLAIYAVTLRLRRSRLEKLTAQRL